MYISYTIRVVVKLAKMAKVFSQSAKILYLKFREYISSCSRSPATSRRHAVDTSDKRRTPRLVNTGETREFALREQLAVQG